MKNATKKTAKIEVEIRQHPRSSEHWIAIVTTARGYCYSCVWADPKPSEEVVRQVWAEDRKAFDPYRS